MQIKNINIIAILTLIFFLIPPCSPARGGDKPSPAYDKVVIYMVDNLTLDDIDPVNTPFLWQIQKEWGVGLLNTSAAPGRSGKNACATLSAGKPALGSNYSQLNFGAAETINGEKAGDIFYRHTGIKPHPENIVVSTIMTIKNNNLRQNRGEVGKLGEKIKAHGYTTLVIGNADRPGYHVRLAPVVLMDQKGLVDRGIIDQTTTANDPSLPSLVWTDYEMLEKEAKKIPAKTVAVIEYGDLYRLEAMASLFSPAAYQQKRTEILRKIDSSIASIAQENQTSASYIINLQPSQQGKNPSTWLMPIWIKKSGYEGLLQSFSTRREGIITLENLHYSILNSIGAGKEDPLFTKKEASPITTLKEINRQAVFNLVNQASILTFYALLAILSLALALSAFKRKKEEKFILILLSFPLAIPAVLLIMPLIKIYHLPYFLMLSLILTSSVVGISWLLYAKTRINPIMFMAGLNMLLILIDTLFHLDLVKNCIMSYQLINGIRYFGIGNEYMGILIGSVITWSVLGIRKYPSYAFQVFLGILLALTIFVLASPHLGANFGGTITACLALSYTWLKLYNQHLKNKDIAGIIILTLIVLSFMITMDLKQPSAMQSHIGKSINAIIEGGWPAFMNIINAKLLLYQRVINYTQLGWAFLILLLTFSFILLKPSPLSRNLQEADPVLFAGIQGLLLGAIAALVFNDSGIIPAGYLFWFAATLLLYMQIKKGEI
ncbi:hypothetical protein SAMN02745221_01234 [Thermosyntropha lipolytica DSM 11003]|uniref:Uncharacterized protein n=1 Tax=Thermosyntropha lipolytica DSM 11003 TaxID=1123382 RepID=A0A1M5NKM8_9FIRM|nr:hypothetical protein [Thermosyntropha lipolytica]SHG90052.1 hypothetical protein SAMN02745221_01234 [Thermosyntropha lipolytica DSM 11003]